MALSVPFSVYPGFLFLGICTAQRQPRDSDMVVQHKVEEGRVTHERAEQQRRKELSSPDYRMGALSPSECVRWDVRLCL